MLALAMLIDVIGEPIVELKDRATDELSRRHARSSRSLQPVACGNKRACDQAPGSAIRGLSLLLKGWCNRLTRRTTATDVCGTVVVHDC
jgi:hypothetical protein